MMMMMMVQSCQSICKAPPTSIPALPPPDQQQSFLSLRPSPPAPTHTLYIQFIRATHTHAHMCTLTLSVLSVQGEEGVI